MVIRRLEVPPSTSAHTGPALSGLSARFTRQPEAFGLGSLRPDESAAVTPRLLGMTRAGLSTGGAGVTATSLSTSFGGGGSRKEWRVDATTLSAPMPLYDDGVRYVPRKTALGGGGLAPPGDPAATALRIRRRPLLSGWAPPPLHTLEVGRPASHSPPRGAPPPPGPMDPVHASAAAEVLGAAAAKGLLSLPHVGGRFHGGPVTAPPGAVRPAGIRRPNSLLQPASAAAGKPKTPGTPPLFPGRPRTTSSAGKPLTPAATVAAAKAAQRHAEEAQALKQSLGYVLGQCHGDPGLGALLPPSSTLGKCATCCLNRLPGRNVLFASMHRGSGFTD